MYVRLLSVGSGSGAFPLVSQCIHAPQERVASVLMGKEEAAAAQRAAEAAAGELRAELEAKAAAVAELGRER